jgi:membrane-associated protease RseP (regulator of RpoE activity)
VPVLRVVAESPAALAGIQPGDVVYAADGQPITETAQLLTLIAAKKPSDRLTLHLQGVGGSRAAELTLGATAREVPLNDPAILYNSLMMDLRQQIEGYPGTEAAALARLNLALCSLHFRDYVAAHEQLLKARTELPQRPGISQGTALYYLGLALERLNYPQDAAAAYRAAAGATSATILDNDGPSVAELVARRVTP